MPVVRIAIFVLALVAACTEAAPIAEKVCGNGVVELPEDCDTVPDTELGPGVVCGDPEAEAACRYTCRGDASCPIGWGCGQDTVCRRAVGRFRSAGQTQSFSLSSWDLALGDSDGHMDILGTNGDRVEFWRGDGFGSFQKHATQHTALHSGPSIVSKGNNDRPFLLAPTAIGILGYRVEPTGEIVASIASSTATNAPVRLVSLSLPGLAGDQLLQLNENSPPIAGLSAAFFDIKHRDKILGPQVLIDRNLSLDDLAANRVPVANLEGRPDLPADEFGLAFTTSPTIWIVRGEFQLGAPAPMVPVVVDRVVMPANIGDGGVLFADINEDGIPDLLAEVAGFVYVANGRGDGRFFPPSRDDRFDALGPQSSGPSEVSEAPRRFPLAAVDLNGDGLTDYVGKNGIFHGTNNGGLGRVYQSDAPAWTQAIVANVHGDSKSEIVVLDENGEVSLLRQSGSGTTFLKTGVSSHSAVLHLVEGDFDGNALIDVALFEERKVGFRTTSILYGGAGLPTAATLIAQYNNDGLWGVATKVLAQDSGRISSDLLIGVRGFGGVHPVALLVGLDNEVAQPVSLVGGLHSITQVSSQSVLCIVDDASKFFPIANLCLMSGEVPRFSEMPDELRCSINLGGDVDGDGQDELVSLYRRACKEDGDWLVHIVYWSQFPRSSVPAVLEGLTDEPIKIVLADLDGDGKEDLIISTPLQLFIYESNGEIVGQEPRRITPDEIGVFEFRDVVALQLDADDSKELAIGGIANANIFALEFDQVLGLTDHRLLLGGVMERSLKSADLNRDGVDDLLLVNFNGQLDTYQGLSHADSCASGQNILYLNDFPGSIIPGVDDVRSRSSTLVSKPTALEAYPYGRRNWATLLACVQSNFAPFNVQVVDGVAPDSAQYNEVAVTGTRPEELGLEPGTASLAVHECQGVQSAMSFAFIPPEVFDETRACNAVTAAAGVMYGLEWTLGCDNIMGFDQSCSSKSFRDAPYACGKFEAQECVCSATAQNSFQRLVENLGPAECGGAR